MTISPNIEPLQRAWNVLDTASQNVQCVQASELSRALAELDTARKAMRPLVHKMPPAVPFFAPLLAAWSEMDSAAQNSVIATAAELTQAAARLEEARIVLRSVFTTIHALAVPALVAV